MVREQCRRAIAALAVLAALGVAVPRSASAAPAEPRVNTVGTGGGVTCGKLAEYSIYYLNGGGRSGPACIVIYQPGQHVERRELESVAERYQRVFQLRGYRTSIAEDGSAAFLVRQDGGSMQVPRRQDAFEALAGAWELSRVVSWLNAVCGSDPARLEGATLVWNCPVANIGNDARMEVTLNMLRGVPGLVGIRLHNIRPRQVENLIADILQVRVVPPHRTRATYLKSRPKVRVVGLAEEKLIVNGRMQTVRLCMLQPDANTTNYHLAERGTLLDLYDSGRVDKEPTVPQISATPWPDEQPAEEINAPVRSKASEMPSPAEARETYAERLKKL